MQFKKTPHTYFQKLPSWHDPEIIFSALFSEEAYSFWLDRVDFSYMGDCSGQLSQRISYTLAEKTVTINTAGREEKLPQSIFEYLEKKLSMEYRGPTLPFEFEGGFIGYLGYELQAECGSKRFHTATLPDAYFLFVDKFLAFDHGKKEIYLVSISENESDANEWFVEIQLRIKNYELHYVSNRTPVRAITPSMQVGRRNRPLSFIMGKPHEQYIADILKCQEYLRKGESYQICLTNQITASIKTKPTEWFPLYQTLRKINPAPYSAYMRFGNFAIISSSPELFLHIDKNRTIISKPIKGTVKRGSTPEEDIQFTNELGKNDKDFAENTMIVDLVRNDLGKVCKLGSVVVSKFLDVETYTTLHQLVSTITGKLRDDVSVIAAVKAAFPGGSMTGAPKLRAMEIIGEIEKQARGIYSGSLGYFSINGTANLNIIIRSIIVTEKQLQLGAGGAILIQSGPESEYQEMLLKTKSLVTAIQSIYA